MTTSYRLPKFQLIGINGAAGVGKDTIAEYLSHRYERTYTESFAGPLKEACVDAFGMSLENFTSPAKKDSVNPYWNISPRAILQFLGTEIFRTKVSQFVNIPEGDFWLQRMHGRLVGNLLQPTEGRYEAGDTVIITDVRFQNEYEYITQNGGWVIHLTRPGFAGKVGILDHESENGIEVTDIDKTCQISNHSTLEELYRKVETFITLSQLNFTLAETL